SQEGPRQPARPPHDGEQAVQSVELPSQHGPQPVSVAHRPARSAQVGAGRRPPDSRVIAPRARQRLCPAPPCEAPSAPASPPAGTCEEPPVQASRVERPFGAQTLSIETGKLAKQAHGAVVVRYGDTVTLVTAVEGEADEARGFFPLVVDYREKTYAAGKFPGGFIKREGRPTTKEILTSRLIDRPIRPLFPSGYFNEVQIMGAVLSADKENDPDMLCMIGSSAALHVSHIPFLRVTGSVRIGRIANELVVLPTHSQLEESDLDLVVSGTRDAITMIEGFAREMSEENMLQAILFAHQQVVTVVEMVEELRKKAGLDPKPEPQAAPANPLLAILRERFYKELLEVKQTKGKADRADKVRELRDRIFDEFLPADKEPEYTPGQVSQAFEALEER